MADIARKTVSVVIPAHNAADTLPALIDSISRQTAPPLEVIVADDASTDATSEVARACGAVIVHHNQNRGPGQARNSGVARARGEILAFTDADCVLPLDWIARGLRFMSERGLRLTTSGYRGPADSGMSSWFQHWEKRRREPSVPAPIAATNGHNLMIEKELYREAGGMAAFRIGEDYLFGLRLSAITPVWYDPENGVYHRFRPGLRSYFRQKYSFARNFTFITRTQRRSVPRIATFSPAETAVEILRTWAALLSSAVAPLLVMRGVSVWAALAAPMFFILWRVLPFLLSLKRIDGAALDGQRFPGAAPRFCAYSLISLVVRDIASSFGVLGGLWLSWRCPERIL